ncbi:HDOD domain-containing protein [Pseudomonas sp. LRF_L74]|uniref:HDOD domain-containing protein n=1 Tax=Pseudomonas sp. LRF_L74 TaxID=3369422 RepID=UPI003F63823A
MESQTEGLKYSLYFNFLKGDAKVPQMPETSLRLRKLLASDHASLEQVTRLLHGNPPLAAYLLQFAESPLLRGGRPASNLQDVISRLGMQRLNNLVLTFTLQHLFTKQSPVLVKVFRQRWSASLRCAAHAACLAQAFTRIALEDAMLAGLIQDIGSLPLLDEIEDWAGRVPSEEKLQELCDKLSADTGVIVLTTWKLPAELVDCARHRDHWQREHQPPADLIDLVQVALRLSAQEQDDSSLELLPAWRRLLGERDPVAVRTELADGIRLWSRLLGVKS